MTTTTLEFKSITGVSDLVAFEHLAARRQFLQFLEKMDVSGTIACGAQSDGQSVGLLLGQSNQERASIDSVFVSKHFRRQGIATGLVQLAEKQAIDLGCVRISSHIGVEENTKPIRQVLAKRQFDLPKRQRFLGAIFNHDSRLVEARWVNKKLDDPRVEIFPWVEVTSHELDKLRISQQSSECWFPKDLSPLIDNSNLHAPTSFGLRFKNELIGWMITHQAKDGAVTFVTTFARPVPEYPLAGLRLLQETARAIISLASAAPVPLKCAIANENKFFRFVERQIFKYIDTQTVELDVITKHFTVNGNGRDN